MANGGESAVLLVLILAVLVGEGKAGKSIATAAMSPHPASYDEISTKKSII